MTQLAGPNRFNYSSCKDIPEDVEQFLAMLTDCTYIDVEGVDNTRTTVFTVLIHGSEPSGFIAMHRWLRAGLKPHTNMRFIVASVSAAQKEPVFTHRYLPKEEDLNRCFDGSDNPKLAHRAQMIIDLIKACDAQLVVDLHNTSAPSAAFSVSRFDEPEYLAACSFFCDRMLLTHLNVGALIEQELGCTFIAIECGASSDASHEIAYHGIRSLALSDDFRQGDCFAPIHVMKSPVRVELVADASLIYADENDESFDLVIKSDIESCNMDIIPEGYCIGWINGPVTMLILRGEFGDEITNQALKIEQGKLITKHDLQMFMATSDVDMAKNDCLFYIVSL